MLKGLPRFVAGKTVSEALGVDLLGKIDNPLIFKGPPVVGNMPPIGQIYGYDVTILIDVCKALVKAESEGKLLKSQNNIAKQAHVILGASAKAGIKGLVYALAGYDATKEEVIAAFKFYVREEARDYEKEFPDQLYEEWYRLYQLPKPERNKPWKFMHLTVDQVYRPLAKSNGKILELTKAQRESSKARWKRLHQFLSEIGEKVSARNSGNCWESHVYRELKISTNAISRHCSASSSICLIIRQGTVRDELAAFLAEAATKSATQY